MALEQNRKQDDHTLKDVLDLVKRDIFLSLNCHAIAKVEAFDPLTRTIKASIAYKKTYFTANAAGEYTATSVDYPLLTDIPVLVLGGGPVSVEFPIAAGDECILLFNDRDIDNWFASGQVGPVNSLRLHSMSDAIAIVGLHSPLNPLGLHDGDRGGLRHLLGTQVTVGPALVKIANPAMLTLGFALQNLATGITAFATATAAAVTVPAVPGNPLPLNPATIAAITAAAAQVAAAAAQIGVILE